MPAIVHTQAELDAWRAATPGTVAFIPTMGALHEGHLSLVRVARELADRVVVSVFVNPLQFGAGEDFDRYPRTLDSDVSALAGVADAVFAPSIDDVYPPGFDVRRFTAGPVGDTFEGAARPGHFDGMLTVVARLFDMVNSDFTIFGQKDAQQVFLVRRLISDHFPDLTFVVAPTIREADGLAMSSRNRYLSAEDRVHARVLSRALQLATANPEKCLVQMRAELESEPGVVVDYVAAVDPTTFDPVTTGAELAPSHDVTYIVAAKVGSTRLLDTVDVFSQK
jgi:pantoate--beta-alanine ligase